MQDEKPNQEVRQILQEGQKEADAEVHEELLRARPQVLNGPLEAQPLAMEPVALVRDRDRIYGDCLPKFPQPATRAWRSPTRVRQALRLHQHEERCVLARSAEAYIRAR